MSIYTLKVRPSSLLIKGRLHTIHKQVATYNFVF